MSIEAFTRVLNGKCGGGNKKVILLAYANHAGPTGRHAFPSYSTVAEYAECATRTVERTVKSLERDGWLRRGDQDLVTHIRKDRRPVVFDVAMDEHVRALWRAAYRDEHPDDPSKGGANAARPGGPDTPSRHDNLSGGEESTPVENSTARGDDLSGRADDHDPTPEDERPDMAMSDEPSVTVQDPPTPVAAVAGTGTCPAHPSGHPNCRFCGTSARQRKKAAEQRADDQRCTEEQAAWRRRQLEAAERRRQVTAASDRNLAIAKQAVADSKAKSKAAQ